jgi:hypothetical protein
MELELATAADRLFRRDAVDLFAEDAHKFDAAARDDERPEAIGAR